MDGGEQLLGHRVPLYCVKLVLDLASDADQVKAFGSSMLATTSSRRCSTFTAPCPSEFGVEQQQARECEQGTIGAGHRFSSQSTRATGEHVFFDAR
jgi:hypothetical protein